MGDVAPAAVRFCEARGLEHLETIVQNNIAMAKETEDLQLPRDVITAGVSRALTTDVGARYFLLLSASPGAGSSEVLAQLMITTEWSDWRASFVWCAAGAVTLATAAAASERARADGVIRPLLSLTL